MRMHPFAICFVVTVLISPAWANDKPNTPQQNKMVTCQKNASDQQLEGKDRQAFVNDCLKAKPVPPAASAPVSQGQKLGLCSKDAAAKGLKGEERNAYLSECARR